MGNPYGRLPPHDQVARCGWCGHTVGYRLGDGPARISKVLHMRKHHPIRKGIATLLAPLLGGDLLYFPVEWSRVG